jgi:uncharacterized protein DUF6636
VKVVVIVAMLLALGVGVAMGAELPGVKTPTRNISCFYVPIKPTARGTLLCDIKQAVYLRSAQSTCMSRSGLDWHGFELGLSRRAELACTGGILYDVGRDTPVFKVLSYGRTWHYRGFTCTSRATGLTCTSPAGHGLFLSRESYRLW